ncbi:uncharacterized protein A4U43_UnF6380 [Asparagus officinalis]|uniref:Uncharacterized protein n=1 Tax=Asparagus officinalis TaxID=4686 RepID=A0A1R3L6H1_ASPOF|nr:uncharacterized protein A4U43_UnF6380 [Asparagus officinalis]
MEYCCKLRMTFKVSPKKKKYVNVDRECDSSTCRRVCCPSGTLVPFLDPAAQLGRVDDPRYVGPVELQQVRHVSVGRVGLYLLRLGRLIRLGSRRVSECLPRRASPGEELVRGSGEEPVLRRKSRRSRRWVRRTQRLGLASALWQSGAASSAGLETSCVSLAAFWSRQDLKANVGHHLHVRGSAAQVS